MWTQNYEEQFVINFPRTFVIYSVNRKKNPCEIFVIFLLVETQNEVGYVSISPEKEEEMLVYCQKCNLPVVFHGKKKRKWTRNSSFCPVEYLKVGDFTKKLTIKAIHVEFSKRFSIVIIIILKKKFVLFYNIFTNFFIFREWDGKKLSLKKSVK